MMDIPDFAKLLAAVLFLIFSACPILAQTSNGALGGIIKDAQGAVIPGAAVTATNTNTGSVRRTTSGDLGQYRIDAIEPGTYSLTIAKTGFATLTLNQIRVSGSVVTSVNATLKVGGPSETIVVAAAGTGILRQDTGISHTISSAEIHHLPIFNLDPYALAATLPGCSTVMDGSFGFTNGIAYSCNGSRPRANNFLIEGQDNNDAGIHGPGLQPQNRASVQEVAVLLNSTSAEFGHGGGSIANVIYRTGSNNFHGALWYMLSNSALDAKDHADVIAGNPKSKYRESYYGFNLGGPLKKNKLFFFVSYQGDNYRSTANGAPLILPSDAGIATLQQYASNPRIAAMLAAYGSLRGDPTRPGSPAPIPLGLDPVTGVDRGSVQLGLFNRTGVPLRYDSPEFNATGDYIISNSDTLHLRYVRNSFDAPYDFFHFPNNLPGFDVLQSGVWQNAGISHTHIFGPTLINEFRFSYGRMGLSFLPRPDNVSADRSPTISIDGIQGWGANPIVPQGRFHNTYQLQDTVSWNQGRHFLKFGFDLAQVRVRDQIPYNYYGSIQYRAGGGYQALANYLDDYSGGTATISQTFGSPIVRANLFFQNYFIQDTWRVRPNLTLDLGFRYEYSGTPANALNYPAIDYNDLACFPCVVKQQPDFENFGPRFGFAYSPRFKNRLLGTDQWVIHGGFGIYYDNFFTNILDNTQASSPNSVASAISNVSPTRGQANWSTYFSQLPTVPNAKATQYTQTAHLVSPRILQWHLNLHRELPGRVYLDLGYIGTRGEHLYATTFANPYLPGGQQLVPSRGAIVVRDNSGDSIYHALQVQLERKYAHGLFFRVSYTLSKMIDNASGIFGPGFSKNGVLSTWSSVPAVQYPVPRGATDRSVSNYDQRHRLSISYIYDIPRIEAHGSLARDVGYLLNGWQVSGITAFHSGTPYNVNTGFDSNFDGINNDRPSLGNPQAPLASYAFAGEWAGMGPGVLCDGPSLWYFDQCNPVSPTQVHWVVPANGQGNVGRNSLTGPWYTSWAFSVAREFSLRRHQTLRVRAEIFNPFNQAHKDGDGYWPQMRLGQGIPPSGFGTPTFANFATSKHGGRTIRILVKYNF